MITKYEPLLSRITDPTVLYEVEDANGNKDVRTAPEAGDKILSIQSKDTYLNELVLELFGQQSQLGREPKRELKDGKYWLTKAEYVFLLNLFYELRKRTPSPYVADAEKDHPLFKRARVRGKLSATTTTTEE